MSDGERPTQGLSVSGTPVKGYYSKVTLMPFILKSLLSHSVCSVCVLPGKVIQLGT